MAKFTLNCEFDTADELREFLVAGGAQIVEAVACAGNCEGPMEPAPVIETNEELPTDTEETKKRKRRTKAEIEAARQAALAEEEKPVTKEVAPVEVEVVVPPSAVEVLPPLGVATAQPAPFPNFNVAAPSFGSGIPNFAPVVAPTIVVQPQVQEQPVAQTVAANTLPADLLGALGGV